MDKNFANNDDELRSGTISDADFDQTNGKAPGLEGDARDARTDGDLGLPLLSDLVDGVGRVLGHDDEEDGATPEDKDPAVNPNSEDGRR